MMSSDTHTEDEVFNDLSEETFGALVKFMRMSPEEREQVLCLVRELSTDK